MAKKQIFIFYILFILISFTIVYAVGGGGGGGGRSTPSCTADTWTCTDWSNCDSSGMQERTCTLSFDCATADTPKPVEKQSCLYVSNLLKKLKCRNLATLNERVGCRLQLSDKDLIQELQISYLPEECALANSEMKKESCVKLYSSLQPCFNQQANRIACAKRILNVGDIATEKANCGNSINCIQNLREKTYSLIKFRFYELEERAEEFLESGIISNDVATLFISNLELKKQQFNNAKSYDERRNIILEIRSLWRDFINNEVRK